MPQPTISVLTVEHTQEIATLLSNDGSLYQKQSRVYNPGAQDEFQAQWSAPLVIEVALFFSPTVEADADYVTVSFVLTDSKTKVLAGKKYQGAGTTAQDDYNRLATGMTSFAVLLNELLYDQSPAQRSFKTLMETPYPGAQISGTEMPETQSEEAQPDAPPTLFTDKPEVTPDAVADTAQTPLVETETQGEVSAQLPLTPSLTEPTPTPSDSSLENPTPTLVSA